MPSFSKAICSRCFLTDEVMSRILSKHHHTLNKKNIIFRLKKLLISKSLPLFYQRKIHANNIYATFMPNNVLMCCFVPSNFYKNSFSIKQSPCKIFYCSHLNTTPCILVTGYTISFHLFISFL